MIIFWFGAKCLAEYLKLKEEGRLGSPERPRECEKCKGKDCYWSNGCYTRVVEDGDKKAEIEVVRFECRRCGKTISMMPIFVVPKRRYAMKVIASGIEEYATRVSSYRGAVTRLGPVGPSPGQLFVWVATLIERVDVLLLNVQSNCIQKAVEREELETAELAVCPNAGKAAHIGKAQKLDGLAKLVAQGKLMCETGNEVMQELGLHFLQNVEQMQQIFACEKLWKSTPQRARP